MTCSPTDVPVSDSTVQAAPARRVGIGVVLIVGVVWALLAWRLVPWQPVPGGTPTPVPAGEVFTADQVERANAYSDPSRILSWVSLALSLALACLLAWTGPGRRLVARLPQRGPWWVQTVAAVAALGLIGRVLGLPFTLVLWARRREYGLSEQPWDGVLRDVALGWAVDTVMTSLLVLVLLGCAQRWRTWWPAVSGAVVAAAVVVGSWLYPVVVEPLFHDFHSLPAGSLRTAVMDQAQQQGVQLDDVLVADASRRTTTLNAYVSGLGNSRRVVLYDTLVDSVPEPEVVSVVAHELAHAGHDDVLVGTVLGAVGSMLGIGLLGVLLPGLGAGLRGSTRRPVDSRGRGVRPDTSVAVRVAVLGALLALGTQVAAPVQNGISRMVETRADVEALESTGDGVTFIEMQKQLALRALTDPEPPRWSSWWWGSHPGVLQRIAIAQQNLSHGLLVQPAGTLPWIWVDSPEQLSVNNSFTAPEYANTARAMIAAIPASSRPYSTAEAPLSSSVGCAFIGPSFCQLPGSIDLF